MRRGIGIALAVGVVALAALAWWLFASLDAIVERAIEDAGTRALGVPVRVASVDVSLSEGRATVRGLAVANPEGFSSQPAFRFDELRVTLDPASLGSRAPLVLKEVSVAGPVVRYELDAAGRANVEVIRDEAERRGSTPEPAPPGGAEASGPPLRLSIRHLAVAEGVVDADTTALGGEEKRVELPALEMRDVGGRGGVPPAEIARRVALALTERIASTVARNRLRIYLEDQIDDKLGTAGEAAKGLLRDLLGKPSEDTPPVD